MDAGKSAMMLLMLTLMIMTSLRGTTKADMYTTKYDNIDIDAVIANDRLLNNYVGCLLNNKPCSPDASELKKNLPDALATNCSSCSEAQKRISDKLAHHLIDHRPDDWRLLEEMYDPSGAYREAYLSDHDHDHDHVEDDSKAK